MADDDSLNFAKRRARRPIFFSTLVNVVISLNDSRSTIMAPSEPFGLHIVYPPKFKTSLIVLHSNTHETLPKTITLQQQNMT